MEFQIQIVVMFWLEKNEPIILKPEKTRIRLN